MNKLSLLIGATAVATSALATTPTWIEVSTEGPDKYADGTVVQDNEVYALIWVKSGATFEGLNADGTVVNADTSKVIWLLPRAKNGCCKEILCTLKDEDADLASEGSFALYLLDTRTRASAGAEETVSADGTVVAVNTYDKISALSAAATTIKVAQNSVSGEGAVVTAVPADAPQPVVSGIYPVNGKVIITVANTVPYLQYGVSAGPTPSNLTKNTLVDGVNGKTGGEIELLVDDPQENRFFKVIRK